MAHNVVKKKTCLGEFLALQSCLRVQYKIFNNFED